VRPKSIERWFPKKPKNKKTMTKKRRAAVKKTGAGSFFDSLMALAGDEKRMKKKHSTGGLQIGGLWTG